MAALKGNLSTPRHRSRHTDLSNTASADDRHPLTGHYIPQSQAVYRHGHRFDQASVTDIQAGRERHQASLRQTNLLSHAAIRGKSDECFELSATPIMILAETLIAFAAGNYRFDRYRSAILTITRQFMPHCMEVRETMFDRRQVTPADTCATNIDENTITFRGWYIKNTDAIFSMSNSFHFNSPAF
jgi:hypothetical protein